MTAPAVAGAFFFASSPERAACDADLSAMTTLHAFALIFDSESRLLLCRRTKDGKWNLPGGELNDGESPWDAAVREVREETSLKVQAKRLAGVYRVPKESDLVFTFICAQEEGIAHPGDAVEEVGWFPLSALPKIYESITPNVRAIRLLTRQ